MYLDGDIRFEEINESKCEIYLIDYRLPGNKNGVDIAIQILANFPSAPILFITAYENLRKEISKNPIFYGKNVDVLLKPVKMDKIESTMTNLMIRTRS